MLPGAGPSGTERCTSPGGGLRSPRRPRRARPRCPGTRPRLPPRSPRAGGEPRLGEGRERNAAEVNRCGLSGGSLGTGERSALAGAPCRREERLPSSATARAAWGAGGIGSGIWVAGAIGSLPSLPPFAFVSRPLLPSHLLHQRHRLKNSGSTLMEISVARPGDELSPG